MICFKIFSLLPSNLANKYHPHKTLSHFLLVNSGGENKCVPLLSIRQIILLRTKMQSDKAPIFSIGLILMPMNRETKKGSLSAI